MVVVALSAIALFASGQSPCPAPEPGEPIPFCRLADSSRHVVRLATPRYPSVLEQAGIGGRVEVAFVLDTLGRVDLSQLRVFFSSHRAFEGPVREALASALFARPVYADSPVRASLHAIIEFVSPSVPEETPSRPAEARRTGTSGYEMTVGREPVPEEIPTPKLTAEDSLGAMRTALLAEVSTTTDTAGRALCVSLVGQALDSVTLTALRSRRKHTVPIGPSCPPTYSSMIASSRKRPKGALDPDILTIGRLIVWTRDLVVVPVHTQRGSGGTNAICDLVRVSEAPGWRLDRCRMHSYWIS